MEPLAKHYGPNHEMVSFQAKTAALYLETKEEVKSFCEMIYHLLPVEEARHS